MNLLTDKKGQVRLIETIIAAFVILSAITFVNAYSVLPTSQEYETSDLEKMGHNIFHDLDENGILSQFVYGTENERENLMPALMVFFPPDLYFDLTIYDTQGTLLNQNSPIRFGESKMFEESNSTVSVSFILPGNRAQYDPRILLLQLVRGP
jgi:hypothetical protein